jgi:hypothetical protein
MRKVAGRAVTRRVVKIMMAAGAVASLGLGMVVFAWPASAHTGAPTYYVRQILSGQSLHHWYTRAGSRKPHRESLTKPDDITAIGGYLFAGFQKPLPHHGGTDAISFYNGQMLISASAPGTTGAAAPNAAYPAVYSVILDQAKHVAFFRALFYDESSATAANGPHSGKTVKLALTDPDSNEVVPWFAPRFGGDFMLTSQGDLEQIYVHGAGTWYQHLSVLTLPVSVDDTAWATSWHGAFYTTDNGADTVDVIAGTFWPGTALVAATPCNANSAPATCPAPGFPANYLGQLNMYTGHITPLKLHGPSVHPQGLIFVAS